MFSLVRFEQPVFFKATSVQLQRLSTEPKEIALIYGFFVLVITDYLKTHLKALQAVFHSYSYSMLSLVLLSVCSLS